MLGGKTLERGVRVSLMAWVVVSVLVFLWIPRAAKNATEAVLYSLSAILALGVVPEIAFRIMYKFKTGAPYTLIAPLPFKQMYIEPHPYLPFVYKKNCLAQKAQPFKYPLHSDKKFMARQLYTNNYRCVNGEQGNRDIQVPKPEGMIRINCLGSSTTLNYIEYQGRIYSYPLELERKLEEAFPEKTIEVNNCGMGGWTSAEIMINFLLNLIDTKPDVVVLYHAYSDLTPSLTDEFQTDYSHARKNIGEVMWQFKLASMVPYIPLAFINFSLNYAFIGQNIRYGLLRAVSKNKYDLNLKFQGFDVYKRNIEHIVNICAANGIDVMLSTFCIYEYNNSDVLKKFHAGVAQENRIIAEIAKTHNTYFVDNNALIPKEEKYFVDNVHFSPEGMTALAHNFSKEIEAIIRLRMKPN